MTFVSFFICLFRDTRLLFFLSFRSLVSFYIAKQSDTLFFIYFCHSTETKVEYLITSWKLFHNNWLEFEGPSMVIMYDDLLKDLLETLKRVSTFLNYSPDQCVYDCVIRNREGLHQRIKHKKSLKIPKYLKDKAQNAQEEIINLLQKKYPRQRFSRLVI